MFYEFQNASMVCPDNVMLELSLLAADVIMECFAFVFKLWYARIVAFAHKRIKYCFLRYYVYFA